MRRASVLVGLVLVAAPLLAPPVPGEPGCTDTDPPNDCFANAVEITTHDVHVQVDNTNAGVEPGEPLGPDMGNTVWWRFTPPYDAGGSFSVAGSDGPMGVVVYERQADDSLVALAYASGASGSSWAVFECVAGRTYYVQAGGEEGWYGTVDLHGASCLPDVPGAPDVGAGYGDARGEVRTGWSLGAHDDGGAPLTNWTLQRGDASCSGFTTVAVLAADVRAHVDVGRAEGTPYCYRVAARNEAGLGAWSDTDVTTPRGVASEVRDLRALAVSESAVHLEWSLPLFDGGADVVAYRVLQRAGTPDGPYELLYEGTSSGMTIGGIPPRTAVFFRVSAVNGYGEGPASATNATTFGAPTPPRGVVTHYAPVLAVAVAWEAPQDEGGTPVTEYVVLRGPKGGELAEIARVGADVREYRDRPPLLRPFDYAVVAVNAVGASPASTSACGQAFPPPPGFARC